MIAPVGQLLAAAQPAPPWWLQFAPLVLIFLVFYFVAIAPMRKRQRELQQTIEALERGDRVITTGGIYGEVVSTDPESLVLKVGDNVKIRVTRSAVAGLQNDGKAKR